MHYKCIMRHLDLALLQTFVAIADNGSFTQAAKQVHRTQSAVSLQMQRLEAAAGAPLFKKTGRQMETTDAGDLLLNHARMLLALNDEALHALRGITIEGTVRLGSPTDVAEDFLPEILKIFCAAHARIKLEVVVERSNELVKAFRAGKLDLAIALGEMPGGEVLGKQKVMWLAAREFKLDPRQPVPLVLLEAPCIFRNLAIETLDAHGIPWRIAYSTSSLSGLRAAVKAGLGITPRTSTVRENGLHYVSHGRKLPALGHLSLSLYGAKTPGSPAITKLADLVRERLSSTLRTSH
jgi:DNA-binding transcriptional LysR family regulator